MQKFDAYHVHHQCMLIAFTGSPGCGKTTLVEKMLKDDQRFNRMISVTTRSRRETDPEGEYEYVSEKEFAQREDHGLFLWTTGIFKAQYGTLKASVDKALNQNRWPTVMHLEPGSVPTLYALGRSSIYLIYLTSPPNQLEQRLRERDKGKPEDYFQNRLTECANWETQARQSGLPYTFLPNIDSQFETTVENVSNTISQAPKQNLQPA